MKPLKWYRSLHTGKGRQETGMFLVEGPRALRQVYSSQPQAIAEIICSETYSSSPDFPGIPVRFVTESQFKTLGTLKSPQGICAIVRLPAEYSGEFLPAQTGNRILLLEGIQDPGNTGTLIRTAVAFGFSGIILSHTCADPFAPKTVQASAGTIMTPWIRRTNQSLDPVKKLKQQGFTIIAADPRGSAPLDQFRTDKLVCILGNEGNGISPQLLAAADALVAIPIDSASAESLNVAAAGAICMFCARACAH